MDFRRIPFQFSSTDPAKRQAELQKRFGLPLNTAKDKMHIDFENPGLMGFRPTEKSSASSSPRLQHRVPVFVEGDPEPMKSSVDSQGSPVPGRKPHVRVVPIEIEGDDVSTKRHRNLSGPANSIADRPSLNRSAWLPEEFAPYIRPPVIDPKPPTVPCERTIPIQVEGVQNKKAKTVPVQKQKSANLKKETKHGCGASKAEKPVTESKKTLSVSELSLKKIEGVLEKLKTYHSDVEKFTGTVKEKQYRYLDEMLTRLMLELDNIDTMGNEEVRLSRKAAVRKVQASVDLLEEKVNRESSTEMPIEDNPVDVQDAKVEESQDVAMDMPSTQEESVMSSEDSTMPVVPEEILSKSPAESGSETEEHSEVKVEMENYMPDGQAPEETSILDGGPFQLMEVDENTECDTIESEPVVTTADSPIEENIVSESNELPNVPVEIVSDGGTSDVKEIEQEPVVTLADSPVQKIKTMNETFDVDVPIEDTCKLEVEMPILSEASACAKDLITKCSQEVSCEDNCKPECHKLASDEHSEITESKHSPEVPDNELLSS